MGTRPMLSYSCRIRDDTHIHPPPDVPPLDLRTNDPPGTSGSPGTVAARRNPRWLAPISSARGCFPSRAFTDTPPPPPPQAFGAGWCPSSRPARPRSPASPQPVLGLLDQTVQLLLAELHLRGGHGKGVRAAAAAAGEGAQRGSLSPALTDTHTPTHTDTHLVRRFLGNAAAHPGGARHRAAHGGGAVPCGSARASGSGAPRVTSPTGPPPAPAEKTGRGGDRGA